MQNIAEFRIIGRVGKVVTSEKVTRVDIAANYGRKVGDEWQNDTHWNTVTFFGKAKERADKLASGDLVHVTGRVRSNRFEKDGETRYGVDLVADGIGTLIKNERDDDEE